MYQRMLADMTGAQGNKKNKRTVSAALISLPSFSLGLGSVLRGEGEGGKKKRVKRDGKSEPSGGLRRAAPPFPLPRSFFFFAVAEFPPFFCTA